MNKIKYILLLVAIYQALYLLNFWQTPLGIEPVLDGSENVLLSEQIFNNELPKEPFYRSMLYPATLALTRLLGFDSSNIMFVVGILGLLFHLSGTFMAAYIANFLWKNTKIVCITAIIYGFYPPFVYFAGEPLDTVMAITLSLASTALFLKAYKENNKKSFIYSGLLFGLCVLCRSNYLPAGVAYLYESKLTKKIPYSIISLIIVMLIGSFIGYIISDNFRLMPWQGAYALFAANKANSNGKFYRNTIDVSTREKGTNPSRAESEIIYTYETGKISTDNINEFNKFWYKKTFDEILKNKSSWLLLTFKRMYYLLNNFEQYNNKTFLYHKINSPILKYNPLCFGIIFILFLLSLTQLNKNKDVHSDFIFYLITQIIVLSVGIIAFYVSGRFRLMIVPFMIPIASGFLLNLKNDYKKAKFYIVTLIAGIITFTAFFDADNKSTFKEDMLLSAFASSRIGMFNEQIAMASKVLQEDSNNILAARVKLSGVTNLLLNNWKEKINMSELTHAINLLRKNKIYYYDTILIEICYSLFYEKNIINSLKYTKLLPNDQWQFLLPILISCYFKQ